MGETCAIDYIKVGAPSIYGFLASRLGHSKWHIKIVVFLFFQGLSNPC